MFHEIHEYKSKFLFSFSLIAPGRLNGDYFTLKSSGKLHRLDW